MLVLTRDLKNNEVRLTNTVTGEYIGTVSFQEIRGNRVRLGFDFGPEVAIYRGELTVVQRERPLETQTTEVSAK